MDITLQNLMDRVLFIIANTPGDKDKLVSCVREQFKAASLVAEAAVANAPVSKKALSETDKQIALVMILTGSDQQLFEALKCIDMFTTEELAFKTRELFKALS